MTASASSTVPGAGKVAEVYPGASLRIWGLLVQKYRVDRDARERLLAGLPRRGAMARPRPRTPTSLLRTDDALDALLAALTARAHLVGQTFPVPEEHRTRATREGWIALPSGPLSALLGGSTKPGRHRLPRQRSTSIVPAQSHG